MKYRLQFWWHRHLRARWRAWRGYCDFPREPLDNILKRMVLPTLIDGIHRENPILAAINRRQL